MLSTTTGNGYSQFWNVDNLESPTSPESYFQGAVAAIGAIFIVVSIVVATAKRRWKDEEEGCRVDFYGGPDGGIVIYREENRSLSLLYAREKDTVFVPSDSKWKEIMPEWSRERKDEIVARIKRRHGKRLIGKSIAYEESDSNECMAVQVGTEEKR